MGGLVFFKSHIMSFVFVFVDGTSEREYVLFTKQEGELT